MKLADRTAIVTGGGRGIGEAIALALAEEGARVIIAARTKSEVEAVAMRGRAAGMHIVPCQADVTNQLDVERLMAQAGIEGANLDILVNNAGVAGPIGAFAETDFNTWWEGMDANLRAVTLCTRMALPRLISQRRGKIINLSGGGATAPTPNMSAYAVAKVGIVRFTETLAEELAPFGIQVNAIAPGLVATRIHDAVVEAGPRAGPELYNRVRRLRSTGEGAVSPRLAAALAVFLASDDSGSLTGRLISAPYDPWLDWRDSHQNGHLSPMYTLRRIDPHTLSKIKSWQ